MPSGVLERIEATIRRHELIARAAPSPASSRAAPTRPASGTCSAASATTSPPSTSITACAAPTRTPTRATASRRWAPRSSASSPARDRGGDAGAPLRGDSRSGPARHRSHGVRSGRDRAVPARLERLDARHQVAPRGRCRPPAARSHARRDGGLLPRARPAGSRRRDQPGHHARPDPRRDPARCCAVSIHAPTPTCSRSPPSGRACHARSRPASSSS